MHMLLSRAWRHRLVAAHAAAGASMLGAGLALLAWNDTSGAGPHAVTAVLVAHLALLTAVLGLVAFKRACTADPARSLSPACSLVASSDNHEEMTRAPPAETNVDQISRCNRVN